jgi:hypothetical protein
MQDLSPNEAVSELTAYWDVPEGFFYKLRQGKYDRDALDRLEAYLCRIRPGEDPLPQRFVALTWTIPTFMEWQAERVGECGGDVGELQAAANRLRSVLNGLLGVP